MAGYLFHFCSEWQRARRVVQLDTEALRELLFAVAGNGDLRESCSIVEQYGLAGWKLDVEEAIEAKLLSPWEGAEGLAACYGPGPALLQRNGSPDAFITGSMMRSGSPRAESRASPLMRSASPKSEAARPTTPAARPRTPRDADRPGTAMGGTSARGVSGSTPGRKAEKKNMPRLLFRNPSHPLAELPLRLSKDEFVFEMKRRLVALKLFPTANHIADTGRGTILSEEDAEDLFEILMLMQNRGDNSTLLMGRQLDTLVDDFFALHRFRALAERGASSLAAFFKVLDLDADDAVELCELRHFLQNVGVTSFTGLRDTATANNASGGAAAKDSTAPPTPVASAAVTSPRFGAATPMAWQATSGAIDMSDLRPDAVFSALDFNKDSKVELWELRRQLSLLASPRISLAELCGHFVMKYGVGKCGAVNNLDRPCLFDYLNRNEKLDLSPEDVFHLFRAVVGPTASHAKTLFPSAWDDYLKQLPVEVTWGVEPLIADQFYCAIGAHALQWERSRRRDLPLPMEALLMSHDVEDLALPDEERLQRRFDTLWLRCFGGKDPAANGGSARHLKEGCFRRFADTARAILEKFEESSAAAVTPKITQGKADRVMSLPRPLFPNIGDVLAVASTRLHSGQSCVVRYRLCGGTNFWGPAHTVLKDDPSHSGAPVSWPVKGQDLGQTPFIGLVPRGLRWSAGGGGGFYLGVEAFTRVDASLKADLPRDPASGLPLLFGSVEIIAPSLVRAQRANHSGDLVEGYELRCFCSNKGRIVGCIGEPLMVSVVHIERPPPVATLQVRCDGPSAELRWGALDLGPRAKRAPVDSVRLHMKGGNAERTLSLLPETTEWSLEDLNPDTEYEFHVRLENQAGHGRESTASCRTNSLCSAPSGLSCAMSHTCHIECRWIPPKVLGNETTKDRWQHSREAIEFYEATLHLTGHETSGKRTSRCASEVDLAKIKDDDGTVDLEISSEAVEDDPVEPSSRVCQWPAGSWKEEEEGKVSARLDGLRPDSQYALEGFCAVNTMGRGAPARTLYFWTVPQTPKISTVKVKGGEVLVALSQTGGSNVEEYSINVLLTGSSDKKGVTFDLKQSTLRAPADSSGLPEISLPFEAQPDAESHGSHTFVLRASNAGGWSSWSSAFEACAVARQQGADQAQVQLIKAIEAKRIEDLARVLKEVRDIEFHDDRYVVQATALLEKLQHAKSELMKAMQARDPVPLKLALDAAREAELPDITSAEKLLRKLEAVVQKLETAKGIDALRFALKSAHEARLPARLLTEAVERLGTREAAQQALLEAMEAGRVPGLQAALDTAYGMCVPAEDEAAKLLVALRHSEQMLQAAIEKGRIIELDNALQDAEVSRLQDEVLLGSARELVEKLRWNQETARERLRIAEAIRHPAQLADAISLARSSQVPEDETHEAEVLHRFLEAQLARVINSQGLSERREALEAARNARLPARLLQEADVQLQLLNALEVALKSGVVDDLQRALRQAEKAGVKPAEIAETKIIYNDWSAATHEVEVAVALGRTERLRKAMKEASETGVHDHQLESAGTILKSLERRDAAAKRLRDALEGRRCEFLQKALKQACDADVVEDDLINKTIHLLDRLLTMRTELAAAADTMDLKTLYDALEKASTPPALPEKERIHAEKALAELQRDEHELILNELERAMVEKNFRVIDHLVARARAVSACGVVVEDIDEAERIASMMAEDDRQVLEDQLQEQRSRKEYEKWLQEVPEVDGEIPLPSGVINGEIRIAYNPIGTMMATLPREIVEGTLVISFEDGSVVNDVNATATIAENLLQGLQKLLDDEDDIHRLDTRVFDGHGKGRRRVSTGFVDGRYETSIFIYVRAAHSASAIAEALVERGQLGGDLWNPSDEATADDPTDFDEISLLAGSISRHMTNMVNNQQNPLSLRPKRLSDYIRNVNTRVLRRINLDLAWSYQKGVVDSLDAACFVFDDENLMEIIDHRGTANTKGASRSTMAVYDQNSINGAVRHVGDIIDDEARSGKQTLQVRLDLMPRRVTDLVFVLSAYNSRELTKFTKLRATLFDADSMAELTTVQSPDPGISEAVVMCSLYRISPTLWRVNSICIPCKGTARDYKPLLNTLLDLGFPRRRSMQNQVPILLEAMQNDFGQNAVVKDTGAETTPYGDLKLPYAVEIYSHDQRSASMFSRSIAQRIANPSFHSKLTGVLRSGGMPVSAGVTPGGQRICEEHVTIREPHEKVLNDIMFDLCWRFPTSQSPMPVENFLDGSLIIFEGQALRDVVDYRGPHGVRIVHNGVLDYSGVWVGKIGVSDATGGAVWHSGEHIDNLKKIGRHTLEISLNQLPQRSTELFFVVSTPTCKDIARYGGVVLKLLDALNRGHELASVKLRTVHEADVEAVVVCCMCNNGPGNWSIGSFGCTTQGTTRDYRPILLCLRAIQEKRHQRPPEWPHQLPILSNAEVDSEEEKLQNQQKTNLIPRLSPPLHVSKVLSDGDDMRVRKKSSVFSGRSSVGSQAMGTRASRDSNQSIKSALRVSSKWRPSASIDSSEL